MNLKNIKKAIAEACGNKQSDVTLLMSSFEIPGIHLELASFKCNITHKWKNRWFFICCVEGLENNGNPCKAKMIEYDVYMHQVHLPPLKYLINNAFLLDSVIFCNVLNALISESIEGKVVRFDDYFFTDCKHDNGIVVKLNNGKKFIITVQDLIHIDGAGNLLEDTA